MRIRISPSRNAGQRPMINLASMIDVTFLLLMYFMVATVLAEQESRLSTNLASRSTAAAQTSDLQPQNLEVRLIDSTPAYAIGSHVLRSKSDLTAVLRDLPKDDGLYIRVYDDVPVAFAVAAMQAANDAGFDQVTYVPSK